MDGRIGTLRGTDHDDAGARGVNSVRRPPAGLFAGFVACSWLLAMVAIWAVQQVHQDLHEHTDLGPTLHWLRDTAVAVPLAALAIGLAALLIRPAFAGASSRRVRPTAAWLAWAGVAAVIFAVLSIPGNQLHGLLFGAEEEEIGWLADVLLDGSIVLGASLLTLVPVALLGARAWRPAGTRPATDETPRPALTASAGASASLLSVGSTHPGGDR
jgi:hypothetical protein